MKRKKYIPYKNITFCCQDCGYQIAFGTALYGQGRCRLCSSLLQKGKNHIFFGKKRPKHSKQMKGDNNPMFGVHRFGKNAPNFGKNHSKESKLKMSKANKGKKLSKETRLKISNANKGKKHYLFGKHVSKEICLKISKTLKGRYSGKKNPRYINGQGNTPYPSSFNDNLKLKIRERDNFTCQYCNLKEQNHFRDNKQINLIIHHINYNKENCKEINLITLCNTCNAIANSNRDYWFAYYTYIIEHFKEHVS
jgi:hypothetical protein